MLTLVTEGKKRYLPLLLLGDEQESMIDRYLEEGALYIWKEGEETAGVCVVADQGNGVLELKNIAVDPRFQRRGIGRAMIEALAKRYRGSYRVLLAGTGEAPSTLGFYQHCGFTYSHRVKDFFLQYDHPIVEEGVQLKDMVFFQRTLEP
ncbi:MAG TPA: GNAT family N-acetyltransferase [Candidatus Egerieicola faecale]|uniref:GNAT family N-acetyltransferase n=1 Tax=Candidatus Egerieicola faecale TaxID=2840774 RepID=A0A9D1LKI3_9FIRM|nr:GNAT family N-acetyltransferase [Candidatus Egerieicola faecale]